MRTDAFPDPAQYVAFEVTIPRGSEAIVTALRDLAITFDLPVRERPALSADLSNDSPPESWQLKEEHFIKTSRELWNSENYGISIVSYLQSMRLYDLEFPIWANGMINEPIPDALRNAEVAGAPFIPLWKDGEYQPQHTGYSLTDQALLTRARVLWDHYHMPFTLRTTFNDAHVRDALGRSVTLSSGAMTRERLADYVRANNQDKHRLHGALGKMLDTMCVVAGVIEKSGIGERDVDTEFIEAGELEQMVATSGLRTGVISNIFSRMRDVILGQLSTGQPYEHGEVIVEGKPRNWIYDRIATSSLAALAKSYKRNKKALGAQFLRQFE